CWVHGLPPPTSAAGSLVLALVALAAAMWPAWRAASVNPTEALPVEGGLSGAALAGLAASPRGAAPPAVPPRLRLLTSSASPFARGEYTGAPMVRGKK